MILVNGQFPGPQIRAHEGDIIVVNVTNLVVAPVTIHWSRTPNHLNIIFIVAFLGNAVCLRHVS